MKIKSGHIILLLIFLYGIFFLLPYAGSLHLFDWDEIIFAESAREMILSGNYMTVQSNFEPFWEKPPLFIWMQVLSMKAFGINEFAARFPNVICGMLTLLVLFLVGRKLFDHRFGYLWSLAYGTSILPFFYFRTGLIDPWFNLFIFVSVSCFVFYLYENKSAKRTVLLSLSAVFLGLAVLTKGPVALLLFVISFLLYFILKRGKMDIKGIHVLLYILLFTLVGGFWFILMVARGEIELLREFIIYQKDLFSNDFAGHSGFPGFHIVVLFFGVFPASLFTLQGFKKGREDLDIQAGFRIWMSILLLLVLVLFSIVATKLVHYSALAYFPITFFAARFYHLRIGKPFRISRWQTGIFIFTSVLLIVASLMVPVFLQYYERIISILNLETSLFLDKAMQADFRITALLYMPSGFLLLAILAFGYFNRLRGSLGFILIHASALLFTLSALYLFAPRIELLTQGAAIEFFKSKTEENAVVCTLGYKSYANLFYAERSPGNRPVSDKIDDFLISEASQPVYFILKADKKDKLLLKYPELVLLEEKYGYVFTRLQQSAVRKYP